MNIKFSMFLRNAACFQTHITKFRANLNHWEEWMTFFVVSIFDRNMILDPYKLILHLQLLDVINNKTAL